MKTSKCFPHVSLTSTASGFRCPLQITLCIQIGKHFPFCLCVGKILTSAKSCEPSDM